jgi:hypothetical protein
MPQVTAVDDRFGTHTVDAIAHSHEIVGGRRWSCLVPLSDLMSDLADQACLVPDDG